MNNKVYKVSEEAFELAAQAIKNGEVVCVPTDAVYAVICDANNKGAVEKLRTIRKSKDTKPLTLIINKDDIPKYADISNDIYKRMIQELLPGKVSFLLKKKGDIFNYAVPDNDSICVFWQDNETKKVAEKAGVVLAISSANTAGNSEATTVEKAMEYFGDGVAMYIDSQEERGKKGTTQLDLRTGEIKVMRESDTLPMRKIREILREKGIEV